MDVETMMRQAGGPPPAEAPHGSILRRVRRRRVIRKASGAIGVVAAVAVSLTLAAERPPDVELRPAAPIGEETANEPSQKGSARDSEGAASPPSTLKRLRPYPRGDEPFTVTHMAPGYPYYSTTRDAPGMYDLRFRPRQLEPGASMILITSRQGEVQPVESMMSHNGSRDSPWQRVELRGTEGGYSRGEGLDILYWLEDEHLAFWVIVRHVGDSPVSRDVMVDIAEALRVHDRG